MSWFSNEDKLVAKIKELIADLPAPTADRMELSLLRDGQATIRADLVALDSELRAKVTKYIGEERKRAEQESRNLTALVVDKVSAETVHNVEVSLRNYVDEMSQRLASQTATSAKHAQEMREIVDTLQYVLDGPDPVQNIINNYLTGPTGHMPWARPLGMQ